MRKVRLRLRWSLLGPARTDCGLRARPGAEQGRRHLPADDRGGEERHRSDPHRHGLFCTAGRNRARAQPSNLTGFTWDHGYETNVKSLELLKETLPQIRRVAVMWDATDTVHPIYARYFEQGAPRLGLKAVSIPVRSVEDLDAAFAGMRKEKVDALIVLPSAQLTVPRREAIMALASRDRMPTLALQTVATLEFYGALLHYGPNLESTPRRAARYVHQIFKGAKPSELPIEQPDKYDLWVDLKAAQTLGVKVPQSILGRADRVIE